MKIPRYSVLLTALVATSAAHAQTAMTIAKLQASTACSDPVFITDTGKEGMFVKSTDASLKLNGGTTLACNAGSASPTLYRRIYDSTINAKWFGLVEGESAQNNAEAVQSAINWAKNGQEVLIPEGSYFFRNSITLRDDTYIRLTARGELSFGARDGIIVRGRYGHVVDLTRLHGTPWQEHPTYGYTGSGITLINAQFATVKVNWVDGFQNAIKLTAQGLNGTQYNKISFEGLKNNDVGILLTTENDGYKNWIAENTFTGGKITGLTGLSAVPAPLQEGFSANKFYNVGFEGLTTAVNVDSFQNNIFVAPRFFTKEAGPNGFKFSPNSWENVFVTAGLEENAFTSNGIPANAGKRTLVLGRLLTNGGVTSGVLNISDNDGRFLGLIREPNSNVDKDTKSLLVPLSPLSKGPQ